MSDRIRVPVKDDEFNTYINATANDLFLTPGGAGTTAKRELFGLTITDANQWNTYRGTWNGKYATVTDQEAHGIRNSGSIAEKNEAKEDFTDWVTDPDYNKLNRIGSSPNCSDTDRELYRIKKRKDNRTIHKAPINEDIFFNLKALGGGDMRCACRTTHDGSRSSIPTEAGAKAVEIKYKIGGTPPTSANQCDREKVSTKALFTFNVNGDNAGEKMYAFARWIDTSDDSRAGAWSDMVTVIIT